MNTDTFRKGRALMAGLTLMTTLLATTAMAQGPGGGFGGPPPGPGGGFGGPGGGGPGGPGGFGGQGRPPFAVGAVSAVDTGAGTITVTSQFGGNAPQVIKVGADVQIVTLKDTTAADLKVGDQVQVQGIPTGITASQVTAGQPPVGLPGMGGFGGPRGGGAPGGGGGNGAGGAPANPSFAMATGTIKVLPTTADPHLTITLGPDVQLFLKVADGAKISKYMTLKLSDIKAGDRVMAAGQTSEDGTLTATSVGVNLPMMQGGFGGGRGGRNPRGFGGPGFGGPGGGGPGGFGGPGFGGPGGGGPGGFGGPGFGGPGGGGPPR